MEIVIIEQAAALLIAAGLGVLLGLIYDIVRPSRRRASKTAATLIDLIYGLVAGCCVFLYIMAAPGGRLGLWELSLMLMGFLIYTWLFSELCYRFTDAVYIFIENLVSKININLKKFRNLTKLFFQNMQK